MTGCVCSKPGWCKRHNCDKPLHFFRLCQSSERYFQAWEEGRGPGQNMPTQEQIDAVPVFGPGTELHALLHKFLIDVALGCNCEEHIQKMDEWGVEGCRKEFNTIIGWLRDEAAKRKIPFIEWAAKILVRKAISNAEKKERLHGVGLRCDNGS